MKDGAVTAVVSGNRPRELMEGQRVRHAAYDGRLGDLGVSTDQTFVPLISDNWTKSFVWQGVGPMPEAGHEKLHRVVSEAHANGQRVRFWATPELPEGGRPCGANLSRPKWITSTRITWPRSMGS